MESTESTMSKKNSSTDKESDDSDSAEIFRNQFSDTDDDIDQEQVISVVRSTNIPKPNIPPALGRSNDNDKPNKNKDISSNYSLHKLLGRNSRFKQQGADDREDADNSISSSCSCCTDSSCTCSEDEYAISDDDDHWKYVSQTSAKHKNKNFIPIGKTSVLNLQVKHGNRASCLKGFQDTAHRRSNDFSDEQHPTKSRQFANESLQYNTPKDALSIGGNCRTEEKNQSKCVDAKSTTFPPRRTHSLANPLFHSYSGYSSQSATYSASGSVSVSGQSSSLFPNHDQTLVQTNDTAGSINRSSYSSETGFNMPQQHQTQAFSARKQTTEEFFHERRNAIENQETGSYTTPDENNSSKSQSECQSGWFGSNYVSSWNENWTTDDYLVCPNFLTGLPNGEAFSARNKTSVTDCGHRSDRLAKSHARTARVPRMFHRRVKKYGEKDKLREQRFSELAPMMNNPLTELFQMVKTMGIDVTNLLQNADRLGLPLALPCMQCFEASSLREVGRELFSGHGHSSDRRCHKCGGQLQTLASMGKMIAKLRETVAENKFVIRDVYPDGNCMFGTVIDQLRVRGDFRYTVHTLRAAVVDYLRENPKAEDGTPLEMFLTNETWEDYLCRMSEDGQWGDHMVLNALTNVLQTRIMIYGGRSGETETLLTPKSLGEKPSQEEKKVPESSSVGTLYMGHFGETHYVSFRPENWWQKIQERNNQALLDWEQWHFDDPSQSLYIPVPHIDFILRHTFLLEHISNYMSCIADLPSDSEEPEFTLTFTGPIMCKMAPDYSSQIESIAPDISIFFPSAEYRTPSSSCVLSVFQTPVDSVIQDRITERRPLNLSTERSSLDLSLLRLLPSTPALWKGQTMRSSSGTVCLKTFDIECSPMEGLPILYANEELAMHRTLAFKSEWPEVAMEWISRERRSDRPEEHVVQLVASAGCHVIPITPNKNQSNVMDSYITADMVNSQELWSYSFAVAEMKLCNCLSSSQRCCFLLFKSLLDFTCTNPLLLAALPKSVFFYACENIQEDVWGRQPGRCLIVMVEKLLAGLRMKFIPHYFILSQNLLQNVPLEHIAIWTKTVEGIIKQPVMSLYFVLDMLDVTASEIGAVFDDILEDLPKFNFHKSIERSFNETFIPTSGTLIENLVYQREYDFALKSLEDVHEQIRQLLKPPIDLAKVIQIVLPNMVLGYRWCLGLYIDLMKGTSVTKEIGSTYDAIHITEIFGPDIDEDEMPNTVVPSCYSISTGDLKFPTVCAEVMINAGKKRLLSKCLRYYLDTYGELAGEHIVLCQQSCQRMQLKALQGLYITLLETYNDLRNPNEFRELMPNLVAITEMLHDHSGFHDLAWAWETLGEPDKAEQCCPCYGKHGTGIMNSMAQKLLGNFDTY